jgi:hypothetical protein
MRFCTSYIEKMNEQVLEIESMKMDSEVTVKDIPSLVTNIKLSSSSVGL